MNYMVQSDMSQYKYCTAVRMVLIWHHHSILSLCHTYPSPAPLLWVPLIVSADAALALPVKIMAPVKKLKKAKVKKRTSEYKHGDYVRRLL